MKRKQLIAMLMAATMVVSLCACGSTEDTATDEAPAVEASADASGNASGDAMGGGASLTIAESGTFDTFIDENGNEVAEGGTKYTTDYVTADGEEGVLGSWSSVVGFKYRNGLLVENGKVNEDNSVLVLASADATYDGKSLEGLTMTTETPGFSIATIVDSDYTIKNIDVTMNTDSDGTDVNDFAGYGAAILAIGDSLVTIEDSSIETYGVAKLCAFVDDGADLVVKNSTLKVNGGDIYKEYKSTANQALMINPPWVLGISGSARTTNIMGLYSTGTYVDSTFEAADWGALSTDSGTGMHLTAINSDVIVDGAGYGAYAIGTGTVEDYYGCNFDVQVYAVILTGADVNYMSYTGGEEIEVKKLDDAQTPVTTVASDEVAEGTVVNSTINSQGFGFMMHHNASSGYNNLTLNEGTVLNTQNAAVLVKKISANIVFDGAEVNVADGVLVQMIDNDDDMIGAYMDDVFGMPTFNYTFSEGDGWSSTWGVEAADSGWETNVTLKNGDYEGDMFNGTGYTANGASTMNVTIASDATLKGAIAATEYQHETKEFTYYYEDKGYDAATAAEAASKLGHVINQVYTNGFNKVNVTVEAGATWTVTGDSYVDSLTIGDGATVNGVATDASGAEVTLEAGKTYTALYISAK